MIVAYCKTCNAPRSISEKGLCPGCLKYGTIVFDSEINPLKEMLKTEKQRKRKVKPNG